MASDEDPELDINKWDKLIKEANNITELNNYKGKHSIIDNLIDKEIDKRKNLNIEEDDYIPPPGPFEKGFIENQKEETTEKAEKFMVKIINEEGEEEWIESSLKHTQSPI